MGHITQNTMFGDIKFIVLWNS